MAGEIYFAHSGRLAVLASAHASTAGFMWLINPVGSGKVAQVRTINISFAPTAASAFISSPRLTVERVTFTGTASGAAITVGQRNSSDGAPACSVRTASTGLSLVAGAVMFSTVCPSVMTAVGPWVIEEDWNPHDSNDYILLRPGEGLVFRQADNGTTSDTRSATIDLIWGEY